MLEKLLDFEPSRHQNAVSEELLALADYERPEANEVIELI